jgi:hypothetical protein
VAALDSAVLESTSRAALSDLAAAASYRHD